MRNLITDVPGLKVGHAEDCAPRLRRDRHHFRRAGGRLDRFARRRTGHARNRAARPGANGRGHRRHHPFRRLGLRARCRFRRAGLAAGTGPRLCGAQRQGSDRSGGDPVRSSRAAATRTGAAFRPTANSAMRRQPPPAWISRSAALAPAPARPRSTAKAASAPPRRKRPDGFIVGALAAVNAAGSVLVGEGRGFGRRRSSSTANSAAADCRPISRRGVYPSPRAAPARAPRWWWLRLTPF